MFKLLAVINYIEILNGKGKIMMNMRIVETNLNLRIERGKNRMDYVLEKEIAEKQLSFGADIYANVEYMECRDEAYRKAFEDAGYNLFSAVDKPRHRGVLCAVKVEYDVEPVCFMEKPHMLHLRLRKGDMEFNLITFRLLVAGSDAQDFKSRKEQWDKVMSYVDSLEESKNVILSGDWNHGVIAEQYRRNQARRIFNYQMIARDLVDRDITLCEIEGTSFKGYMKIDHIATGSELHVKHAEYKAVFDDSLGIGVPDHSLIIADLAA